MPTHYQGTKEEIQALDAFIKMTRANTAFQARVLAHGVLGNLTLSQFGVLEALYHLGPLCQGVLSQKLLTSTGNMTLVLDNLEKGGLVRRVRSLEDRRMVLIELTEAGKALIARVMPLQVQSITEEMGVLSLEEQALLARLCRKLGMGKQSDSQGALSPPKLAPALD